jgi:uncharacterized protein (TIGR02466 family)
MTYQYDVFPLFSSPVCSMIIEENLDEYFEQLKRLDFFENEIIFANKTFMSKNRKVLDQFVYLKNVILKHFNLFKNDVLHYENTDFIITTSWVTKCHQNSYSQSHMHRNSIFSGVLYFEDHDPESTITFENLNLRSSIFANKTTNNIFNADEWKISSCKNKILFFPSYLHHKIDPHMSSKDRYSLAFNLFPTGSLGVLDSAINIEIKDLT